MKTQPVISEQVKFANLLDVAKRFPTEESCREFLEHARWDGKPVCVHCGYDEKVYRIQNGKLYKCPNCRKPFSVKVGTIFEDSALPLQKWFFAMYVISAHKKGISSCQLARDLEVTQKTAWHMLHRIRLAMKTTSFSEPLEGTIECDESYVGGKVRGGKRGRGSENKTPVFGMVARGGDVRSMPVNDVKARTLKPIIHEHVAKGSTVITDELYSYNGLSQDYTHKRIGHLKKEYVRGGVHTQNIENFWSLLKRGIIGIYHHVSPEHLHRYCDEFEFRYNSRTTEDTDRFIETLRRCSGRLTYSELIS
jgi:transposase-like protein